MKELDKFVDKILAHKPKKEKKNDKDGQPKSRPIKKKEK